jgi:glutaconate CoA-transferase subunit B
MSSPAEWTPEEMMTVAAARALPDAAVCFVGIGLPSTAANVALRVHAPNLVLVYESGALGSRPHALPLSIGDGVLAENADAIVGVVETFNYWLQPGRIDIGFLAGAQLDRFANINTTVIGDTYAKPRVRLPGAGGAPEIAASCREVLIVMRQSRRSFVEQVDFVTSTGFGSDGRGRTGIAGAGPRSVITDLGILAPEQETNELVLTHLHPGVTFEQAREATGWELRRVEHLATTDPPTALELETLRALLRTQASAPATAA